MIDYGKGGRPEPERGSGEKNQNPPGFGKKMNGKNLGKRTLLLIVGLVIMAYGVSFSIIGGLGTSPISSLPFAVSELTPLTVGTATIAMHCVLILLQILLLRKNYHPFQLFQLAVALVFGSLCDLTLYTIQWLNPGGYLGEWACCLIGVVLVAFGVSCEVKADLVPLAGEGFILAVCRAFHRPFPPTKIAFDCTLVILACILGLVFRGQLLGVREGTIAAAILVGLVSKQITKWVVDPVTRGWETKTTA